MKIKQTSKEIINTIIGENSRLIGNLNSQQSIRIEGYIEGEINTQGDVFIGPSSKIKGNIFAKRVNISGEVIGNIEVVKSLEINKTGKVYGNISGDQLKIEEGGIFKGKVNMDIISAKNAYEGKVKLITS